ncbi:acetyl-CoA carboxylase, carboxyltransferase subunit beta [Kallotenue papyrolyticum]|uniref:acetyl-CoA carboxylase, carboxyltransferase subunit beta n=1 Tax=Kallotenue papyrolyticum TaxID=1325125 RepID=UPI0004785352|nr:acetyl-CoA carboxylase, carboxyltransferase subunit beta [Kallotenue papyrolyticum]
MKDFLRRTPRYFTAGRKDDQQIPDDLWHKCAGCKELVPSKQFLDNAKVCPRCNYHARMSACEWVAFLLDRDSWQEYDRDLASTDPLNFVSPKDNYAQKLQQLREALRLPDAAIWGTGRIQGRPLTLCITDFAFMGGSMGSVVGEKVARAAEHAAQEGMPLLTINTSGGARMHEGMLALMQMAKVSVALARLSQARQPHISLLLDNCYGGVTASYASAADIILAEPRAHIGFAGPRVIEQTIRQKLPADFQTAEFLLEHGMIDAVVPRAELRGVLSRILSLYARDAEPARELAGSEASAARGA